MSPPRQDPGLRLAARSEWRGGCLIYTRGWTDISGHVRFVVNGRSEFVHRVAWSLANGPIPDGLIIRHSCDVPRCINPKHLLLGTHADNSRDAVERNRTRALRGSAHPKSKLTDADVIEARALKVRGVSYRASAKRLGVSQSTLWAAVSGHQWPHLSSNPKKRKKSIKCQ